MANAFVVVCVSKSTTHYASKDRKMVNCTLVGRVTLFSQFGKVEEWEEEEWEEDKLLDK